MRRPPHPPSRAAGFTLVEVLVALVVMALMAAMGWQGVAGMARARDIGQASSERTLRLSTVVAQWEADLLAVYDSPVLPGLEFDGAALRLLRRGDGGVQVVVWSLREGRWRRWASPATTNAATLQQHWLTAQQLQGNEPEQLLLTDGVTAVQLYFWRGQGWSNAQSSADVAVAPVAVAAAPAASAASGAASSVGGTNSASATVSPQAAARALLPAGVRLQLDLPEGRLLRDVALAPQLSS